jgi:hypothetical protein
MLVEEGKELLAELIEFATQPRFVYSHQWTSFAAAVRKSAEVGQFRTIAKPYDPRKLVDGFLLGDRQRVRGI